MLYQLFETQRALLSPFSEFAAASAKLYSHPLSPFAHTPMAQREALLDAYERSGLSGMKFAALHGVKYPSFAN